MAPRPRRNILHNPLATAGTNSLPAHHSSHACQLRRSGLPKESWQGLRSSDCSCSGCMECRICGPAQSGALLPRGGSQMKEYGRHRYRIYFTGVSGLKKPTRLSPLSQGEVNQFCRTVVRLAAWPTAELANFLGPTGRTWWGRD
ncbi:hypothetical protein NDU88_002598 [Pleurodeles waltl]|uniref:Uncharacterized protein n=1 Tax=Pleurodeles waltl TaxID=8319 RepID=A0AAV7SBG1_PLEWA|nr:hypothetical protein NDU88_002598 [Pleurodeles waltl]